MSQEQNSQEPFDDIDLMQYVDGELDEVTAAALDSYFDDSQSEDGSDDGQDDERWLKVQALEQMSDTVRSYLELETDAAEPRLDAMWEEIAARLDSAPESSGAVSESRAQVTENQKRSGLWARIVGFFEGYRGYILTGAVAAGAAAAIILAVRPPETQQVIVERPVAMRPLPEQVTPPVASTNGADDNGNDVSADETNGQADVKLVVDEPTVPEIEELEVSGGSGTVFVMPSEGADDVSATVIFIDFDEAEGPIL